jgi:PAS domain S-box-containing protein
MMVALPQRREGSARRQSAGAAAAAPSAAAAQPVTLTGPEPAGVCFEQFWLLAEASPDVSFRYRISPTPGFEHVSPSIFQASGLTPDELYADPEVCFALVHPDDRPFLDDAVAGRRPAPDPFILRWRRRDGETNWLELRATPFARPDGAIGFDGMMRDITARKAAEDALRAAYQETAQLAAMTMALTYEAIIVADLDGTVTSWNAGAESLFGYTAAEMFGQSGLRLAPPEEQSTMRRLIERLAAGEYVDPYKTVRLAKDGRRLDVAITASPMRDAVGEVTGMVVFALDIGPHKRAEEELAASEARFRALAENIPTGLAVVNADMTIGYVNPAFTSLFGYTLEGAESFQAWLAGGFSDPAHAATIASESSGAAGTTIGDGTELERGREHRITCADGTVKSVIAAANMIGDRLYVAFTDVTAQREAEERHRESEERYRLAFEVLAEGVLLLAAEGAIVGSNARARAILGFDDNELLARTWSDPRWQAVGEDGRPFEGQFCPASEAASPDQMPHDVVMGIRVASGELRWLRANLAPLPGGFAATPASWALSFTDITDGRRTEAERDRLVAVVEQATDAIGIADAAGTLIYANSAMAALAGRPMTELLGNPVLAIMGSSFQARVDGLWQQLREGQTVARAFAAHRPDGSAFRAEGTIAPLREYGAISHFIFVARDVTRESEAEGELTLEGKVRAVLAEALLDAHPSDSLEEAVQRICDGLGRLPEIDYAGVEILEGEGGVAVLASHVPEGFELKRGVELLAAHAAYLRARVMAGPWAEYWQTQPQDGDFNTIMEEIGLKAIAIGPIAHEAHVDGLLVIGTRQDDFAKTLVERRPALVASSTTITSALLAERLHERRRQVELHESIGQIIAARSFHPVFQPIVDLESGDVVGYEALARFDSGRRPDLCFADAWSIGLGPELELATLELAAADARELPAGRWLTLNASARLLANRERLREIFSSAGRPIAIEITEHEVISDYHAVRDEVRALGHNVRLAVDDAGAGVANITHIIELRPDFVKLDISLVRRVNADPGRQALVVAMHHFSRMAGCRLIAEGVETEEEARALRELGVEFGQGYWFGRPDRAEAWSASKLAV